jgi:sodium transport system permease protein
MYRQFWVIFCKEVLDAVRDRKALMSAFLLPLMMALTTSAGVMLVISSLDDSEVIELPVLGAENAEPLIRWLEENGIEVRKAPIDPVAAVNEQREDFVLVIPDDLSEQIRGAEPATIWLVMDASRQDLMQEVRVLKTLVQAWSSQVGSLRLLARGVSPQISQPIQIKEVNTANSQKLAIRVLGSMPLVVLMAMFAGSIGLAADVTAGERERRSFEPLLINPVPRHIVVYGKWGATQLFALVVTLVTLALQLLIAYSLPLSELGVRFELSVSQVLLMMVVIVPVVFMGSALQLFVAIFARSFKDAQTYMGLLVMVPMVPGIYVLMNPGDYELWQTAIPLLGPQLLLVDLFGGTVPDIGSLLLVVVEALLLGVLFAKLTEWMLRREATIYG